ncbi:hypothetical protein VCCP103710_2480 [Vibrio cholerae CP1037(10)]|nr:hypothetical protein VCCP103710_2480 [Vibrio cholerae CP1037(10)]
MSYGLFYTHKKPPKNKAVPKWFQNWFQYYPQIASSAAGT